MGLNCIRLLPVNALDYADVIADNEKRGNGTSTILYS